MSDLDHLPRAKDEDRVADEAVLLSPEEDEVELARQLDIEKHTPHPALAHKDD